MLFNCISIKNDKNALNCINIFQYFLGVIPQTPALCLSMIGYPIPTFGFPPSRMAAWYWLAKAIKQKYSNIHRPSGTFELIPGEIIRGGSHEKVFLHDFGSKCLDNF